MGRTPPNRLWIPCVTELSGKMFVEMLKWKACHTHVAWLQDTMHSLTWWQSWVAYHVWHMVGFCFSKCIPHAKKWCSFYWSLCFFFFQVFKINIKVFLATKKGTQEVQTHTLSYSTVNCYINDLSTLKIAYVHNISKNI